MAQSIVPITSSMSFHARVQWLHVALREHPATPRSTLSAASPRSAAAEDLDPAQAAARHGRDEKPRRSRGFFLVHRGFPGKAALIFRKKYSESLNPYAMRFITLILLFTPSSTLVCIG